jgi:hypothetical protein
MIIEHENILSIYIQDTYTNDYLYITALNKNIDRNRIRIRSLFTYRKNKTGMHVYKYIPSGRRHALPMRVPRCCSRRCTHARTHVRTLVPLSVFGRHAILLYFRFLPPFSPVAGRMQVPPRAASSLFFFSARVPSDGNFVRWVVFFFPSSDGFHRTLISIGGWVIV